MYSVCNFFLKIIGCTSVHPCPYTASASAVDTHLVMKFMRKMAKCDLSHAIYFSCDLFLGN